MVVSYFVDFCVALYPLIDVCQVTMAGNFEYHSFNLSLTNLFG